MGPGREVEKNNVEYEGPGREVEKKNIEYEEGDRGGRLRRII